MMNAGHSSFFKKFIKSKESLSIDKNSENTVMSRPGFRAMKMVKGNLNGCKKMEDS